MAIAANSQVSAAAWRLQLFGPARTRADTVDVCPRRSIAMRVHANQVNPNAQLDALYAAERAAAKRAAERTRKKLLEFASELAGEADSGACVVRLGTREESQESPRRQEQPGSGKKPEEGKDSAEADKSISDWA
jgi:hypothetical protein